MDFRCLPFQNSTFYEDNDTCVNYFSSILSNVEGHLKIEEANWPPINLKLSFNDQMEAVIEDMLASRVYCKACDFQDASQYAVINLKENCKFSNDVRLKWQNAAQGQMLQTLYSRSDVLSSLAKAVNNSNKDQTAIDMTTKVRESLDESIASIIINSVKNKQTIQVSGSASGAAYFSGITQDVVITSSVKALQDAQFATSILEEHQWAAWANIYESDTTLSSVGKALSDTITGFTGVLKTTVGAIMFAVLVVLLFVIIGLVGVILWKKYGKEK